MAREWSDVWKLIDERRMTRHGLSFSDPLKGVSTVACNQDRARRRFPRARGIAPDREFDVCGEEPSVLEPPDADTIRAEPAGSTLDLPAHFHLALGWPDPRFTAQEPWNSINAPTSKRPGEPPDSSSNKEKCASKDPEKTDLAANLADFGIPTRGDDHIRPDVTIEGRGNSIVAPSLGWSSFEREFNAARVEPSTAESFNNIRMRGVDPKMAYARGWDVDPVPRSIYDCGAEWADSSEFWMLAGDGIQITRPPDSLAKTNYSQRGVRVGPNASGEYANKLIGPHLMPPAPRKFSSRGISGFLRARGQIGFPASMHADACLGYSATGYQSWGVAYNVLEARKFDLIRPAGPASQGRNAKGILTQKAKAGFCPCCVQATRIANATSIQSGEYSPLKELGMQPSADEGPWAGRRLAADNYVLGYGGSLLPVGWDWAAKSLEFNAPRALIRSMCRGAPILIPTIAESKKLREIHEQDESTTASPNRCG